MVRQHKRPPFFCILGPKTLATGKSNFLGNYFHCEFTLGDFTNKKISIFLEQTHVPFFFEILRFLTAQFSRRMRQFVSKNPSPSLKIWDPKIIENRLHQSLRKISKPDNKGLKNEIEISTKKNAAVNNKYVLVLLT